MRLIHSICLQYQVNYLFNLLKLVLFNFRNFQANKSEGKMCFIRERKFQKIAITSKESKSEENSEIKRILTLWN